MIDERGKLDFALTTDFEAQLLRGLQYMHNEGFVHRDLKGIVLLLINVILIHTDSIQYTADNVLLNKDRSIIKIADFGLAKIVKNFNEDDKDYNIYSAGCPIIQSPEQREGRADGKKNDIWLFGLLMIQMSYGNEFEWEFMRTCQRTKFPVASSSQSPYLNDLISTIFVPESRRYSAGNLLYKRLRSKWLR